MEMDWYVQLWTISVYDPVLYRPLRVLGVPKWSDWEDKVFESLSPPTKSPCPLCQSFSVASSAVTSQSRPNPLEIFAKRTLLGNWLPGPPHPLPRRPGQVSDSHAFCQHIKVQWYPQYTKVHTGKKIPWQSISLVSTSKIFGGLQTLPNLML